MGSDALRRRPTFAWGSIALLAILTVASIVVPAALGAEGAQREQSDPSLGPISDLAVQPGQIVLHGVNRAQQLLISARRPDGTLVDVTHVARLEVADQAVARVDGSTVVGVADGTTELKLAAGDTKTSVAVRVAAFSTYPPVHFANDVIPVFSKLGCNSGGCHGKAAGQNGFKLSVFGFDPAADYNALVKEARGRRLFPADPPSSLLLAKATGAVPHGGGRRMQPGSRDYEVLMQWVRQGAPLGSDNAPQLTGIDVQPKQRVVGFGAKQQILATALYSDGSRRDVSAAAGYTSNASVVADVEPGGLVSTGQVPGEAAVTVNYMGQVAAVRMLVPRPGDSDAYPDLAANNHIDELVWAKLRKMGIVPSELCDDATFLRRLYLDAIGTLPAPGEVRAFLADTGADKRARWIDRVLARDVLADYWALKWADILLVDRDKLGDRGAYQFHTWLREQFAHNRPYDQWVRELMTATGNSAKNGPANFYRSLRSPEESARAVSQAFLGVRIECAQCHHHPFEKWAQEDFFGLAGFFNGMVRKPVYPDPGPSITEQRPPELVYHAGYRPTTMPLTAAPVATKPLGGAVPEGIETGDPRVPLARWMTAPENPWFARLAVNRVWKHFLGRGLVEPEDDLRSTNPPTNEPLLDYLAGQFVASGFDLQAMMRQILGSRVYQLSSRTNDTNYGDDQNFSHYYPKRMPAEVMLDAISAVTESPESFPGRPPGTRAIELWNNRMPSYFLEIFGRPERSTPCECGRSSEPTMSQALHLMNAPEVEAKIAAPEGRVARLIAAETEPAAIVEQLCLAALGRLPDETQRQAAAELFSEAPPKQGAEDFLWTLLNSYDFLFVR